MSKQLFAQFYGNMEWFDIDDDIDDLSMPPVFEQAKELWQQDSTGNQQAIIDLLKPYVGAWFVPEGVSGSEELFRDVGDFSLWEKYSPATKINVVGIDFSTSPFPLCRAEAWFKVPVTDDFLTINLESWQEERGEYIYQAISFGWQIPNKDGDDATIVTWANHQGVEGILLA